MQNAWNMAYTRKTTEQMIFKELHDIVNEEGFDKRATKIYFDHFNIDAEQDDPMNVGAKIADRKVKIKNDRASHTDLYRQETTFKIMNRLAKGVTHRSPKKQKLEEDT